MKRPLPSNGVDSPSSKIRRIQPLKIGEVSTITSSKDELFSEPKDAEDQNNGESSQIDNDESEENGDTSVEHIDEAEEPQAGPSNAALTPQENVLTSQIKDLIKACKKAEHSKEMKTIIKLKLLKYYHSVHPDFINSKNFLQSLTTTTQEILKEPHLVYAKLKVVIEELDARRKSKAVVVVTEDTVEVEGTGDDEKDKHLKELYKGLRRVKRRIRDLEEEEVDWEDDEDSAYIKKVRFEKRACAIYQKICEITGESNHAHRIIKKPIKFKGTRFVEFNKMLTKMVNNKNSFPNFYDILKLLDHCNKQFSFGLLQEQVRREAQDAFEKLGKILQKRRKDDLYESTTFYIGETTDPAKEDPELRTRLEKNKKFYARTDEVINA